MVSIVGPIILQGPTHYAVACAGPMGTSRLRHFFDVPNVVYVEGKAEDAHGESRATHRSELRVIEQFKGKLPKIISLYSKDGRCDAFIEVGKKYLLFLGPPNADWHISIYDAEGPVDLTANELKTLRSYKSVDHHLAEELKRLELQRKRNARNEAYKRTRT